MISKSLENVANCAYAKSPSLEGSNEGDQDLPHLGFQRLTCMHIPNIEMIGFFSLASIT